MQEQTLLYAINEAIWLRDNAKKISTELLYQRVYEIAEYGLFSNRQIALIIDGAVSYATISRILDKTDKTGGKLNPKSLEDISEILFSKARGRTNYKLIKKVLTEGTSQGMISRLTGVPQSAISKKVGEE